MPNIYTPADHPEKTVGDVVIADARSESVPGNYTNPSARRRRTGAKMARASSWAAWTASLRSTSPAPYPGGVPQRAGDEQPGPQSMFDFNWTKVKGLLSPTIGYFPQRRRLLRRDWSVGNAPSEKLACFPLREHVLRHARGQARPQLRTCSGAGAASRVWRWRVAVDHGEIDAPRGRDKRVTCNWFDAGRATTHRAGERDRTTAADRARGDPHRRACGSPGLP
jgi:hypothetical protein